MASLTWGADPNGGKEECCRVACMGCREGWPFVDYVGGSLHLGPPESAGVLRGTYRCDAILIRRRFDLGDADLRTKKEVGP